ncbi:uncharacterized protein LOC18030889 [Eutrema salsugineum]|uniref:uncharacterized protein LOC18030889 n=1 Tax=Eutrema salsugineum TaxID=72664 RepID=UPI000CED7936|nr:uncharacterized protein LOC18030889 [Eutrema salsugineum]
MTKMMNFSRPQVFISFRGKGQRDKLVSFLKKQLERSDINFFMDENEVRGMPLTTLFERIRESSVALVFFSDKYPESCWCLDELVEIKKQMEKGSLVPFPIFYKVKAETIKRQTGCFGNSLLRTEDLVRKKVDRGSYKSILETEAVIWERRQALVSVGGRMGFSYKHSSDEAFVSDLVVKLKELLDYIPSSRNYQIVIENPLMHPQEAETSLLLNLKKSDLDGAVSLATDHFVFLDLNSLKNSLLAQRLIEKDQAGKFFLVLLGSLKDYNKGFAFKPLLFPKKPQQFADVVAIGESNDNFQNLPDEDNNFDDVFTCFSLLCNFIKGFLMKISSPPSRRVSISFGEKQLRENLVSFLKTELESNRISVCVEDEMKKRIKESKVAIIIFSAKYPESQHCLDELVEIKKLMDTGEIDPFPIFYKLKAESVKVIKGWFRNRLLKIEEKVRKNVNRGNDNSILDTEARIWGWREALASLVSRPGLSYQHSSDSLFVTDVVTKVKALFTFRERQKSSTEAATTAVKCLGDVLFHSLTSFLEALNLEITDIEGFTEIASGFVSLSLKRHTNLVFLKLSCLDNLVRFQHSDSFEFLKEGFASNPSGVIRFEEPSLFLELASNQSSENSLIVSPQNHKH